MKIETRYIRQILKKEFPQETFRLSYKKVRSSVMSFDILIINISDGNKYIQEDVISKIKEYTCGIDIHNYGYKGNFEGSHNNVTPKIYMVNQKEYIEPTLLRGIEVKYC